MTASSPEGIKPNEDIRKGDDKKIEGSPDHNRGIEKDSELPDPPQDRDFVNPDAV